MNTSVRWGGGSVATVVEDEDAAQEAFAFYMTPEQVQIMDGYENETRNRINYFSTLLLLCIKFKNNYIFIKS